MPPYPPTARQQQLLSFIAAYMAKHGGVAPSYAEMAAGIGFASKCAVSPLISRLEGQGLIRRLPNRHRAIEIIARPQPVSRAPDGAPLYFIPPPHRTAEEQPAGSLPGTATTAAPAHRFASCHPAIIAANP